MTPISRRVKFNSEAGTAAKVEKILQFETAMLVAIEMKDTK